MVTGTRKYLFHTDFTGGESFLKSKFIKLLKRKIRENNARGLFFDEHTIEPGYTPLFLNVRFSPDKYKILYF
jgi:hypothetical protein